MSREVSYLYVIGPNDPRKRAAWVKIGRSTAPSLRRSQLQVGQGDELKVYGAFKVALADASRLETAVHEAMRPLRIKGEVFQADPFLACAFVEHIAANGEPDEFLGLALARDLAEKEWNRLSSLPSARGRWGDTETLERVRAAEDVMTRTCDAMFDFDFERGCRIDPIAGDIRRPRAEDEPPQKRILRPRKPRSAA